MAPLSLKMRRAIVNAAIENVKAGKPNPFATMMAMKRASSVPPRPKAPKPDDKFK